jgi:hypothetical protein
MAYAGYFLGILIYTSSLSEAPLRPLPLILLSTDAFPGTCLGNTKKAVALVTRGGIIVLCLRLASLGVAIILLLAHQYPWFRTMKE